MDESNSQTGSAPDVPGECVSIDLENLIKLPSESREMVVDEEFKETTGLESILNATDVV
jgi:hypothetical protein